MRMKSINWSRMTIRARCSVAEIFQADLSDQDECVKLHDAVIARFEGLDVLVNNVGGLVERVTLPEMTPTSIRNILDVNLTSVINMSRLFAPQLIASEHGAIISTTSIGAKHGASPGAGLYGASKAFVETFTKNMAKELAPHGVRVNAVAPGVIDTELLDSFNSREAIDAVAREIPLSRIGTAEDCVGAYLFLASETLSRYITGQTISVNGGQFM